MNAMKIRNLGRFARQSSNHEVLRREFRTVETSASSTHVLAKGNATVRFVVVGVCELVEVHTGNGYSVYGKEEARKLYAELMAKGYVKN